MKICLIPPAGAWSVETGFLEIWEKTVENFAQSGENYVIVSDESIADFSIQHTFEHMSSKITTIMKPLSSKDIKTFTWDMADRPTGRLSGFYCSLPRGLFDPRRHSTISYPLPFNEFIEEFNRQDALLDFSFLGKMTSGVRVRLIRHLQDSKRLDNAVVRESGSLPWSWTKAARAKKEVVSAKIEYIELLRKSKFVLCPRGYGTGTFRMFEAMQAGRVPVIISDAYVMPSGIDWDSCSLTISEGRIGDIPAIIRSRLDDWEVLAANARSVWEANFSPRHIMDFMATNLARMSESIDQASFPPWRHSVRMGGALLNEYLRPIAGRVKQAIRS